MPVEIERKFLVTGDGWRGAGAGTRYRQGYLSLQAGASVRVRASQDAGYLTIKGETSGATRAEYEYSIPLAHANELLDTLCIKPVIDKTRYRVEYRGLVWDVDEFAGENAGLVIAEVELESEGQVIELPDWAGDEVTGDPRYYNASLAVNPYSNWSGTTDE
jgi:CYTH domain-containing protein